MLSHIRRCFTVVLTVLTLALTTNAVTPVMAMERTELQRIARAQAQEKKLQRELTCLARNIYFESGSEPVRGKIAVAQVTMNRVNSGQFPDSVCAVVHQKSNFQGLTVCQFSWVCEPNKRIRAPHLYEESVRVAQQVLLQGRRLPELRGAKYFHADYIDPGWNRPVKAKIGRHIFY